MVTLDDFEREAARRLPSDIWDYFEGGARDEVTLRENRKAFERLRLRFRVMRGVDSRELETTVLGFPVSMPILAAPTALQKMAHVDGESAVARATAAEGVIMTVSTMATESLEEVVEAAPTGRYWFQVYVYRDRSVTEDMVRRAERAGYSALVLTVDTPLVGGRERDIRNGFQIPEGLEYANFRPYGAQGMSVRGQAQRAGHDAHDPFDSGLTWADLTWLVGRTDLPVVVKGVVHPEDAEAAIEAGAAGIIVSNHGGRQLDTSIPTIRSAAGRRRGGQGPCGRVGGWGRPERDRRHESPGARCSCGPVGEAGLVGSGRRRRGRSQVNARHAPGRARHGHGARGLSLRGRDPHTWSFFYPAPLLRTC